MGRVVRWSLKAIDTLAEDKGYTLERLDSGVFYLFAKRGERLPAMNPVNGVPAFYSLQELHTFLESGSGGSSASA
jgi:hypothetical protein